MLGNLVGRLKKVHWDRLARRIGAFGSRHRPAGRALLFWGGFALVVLLVHREVYSFILQRRLFTVPEVRTAVAPAWAEGHGVEIVRVDTQGVSLFDPELVDRVGRAFESCAWVRKVTAVERVFPDRLKVRFEYRKPHVAVRRQNGFVVVDAEGVRLPGVYVDAPRCARTVELSGVTSQPPEPGQAWSDPALRAGMAMADTVAEIPTLARLGVREIDLSNFGGRQDHRRSEVSLVTAHGCSIQWGRPAETARYGDLTPAEKLENLREILAAYPDLAGLRCVKLYFRGTRAVELLDAHAQRPR